MHCPFIMSAMAIAGQKPAKDTCGAWCSLFIPRKSGGGTCAIRRIADVLYFGGRAPKLESAPAPVPPAPTATDNDGVPF